MNRIQIKICPFCAEEIKAEAILCKHCGSKLNSDTITDNFTQTSNTETYLSPGMHLGDYEIVRLIGSGGMGVVYEVIYHGLNEPVKRAIKTIPNDIKNDEMAVIRMKREVAIAQELSHPHIVRTYTYETYQDHHFIVMEFVDGPNLEKYIYENGRKLDLDKSLEILKGVAEALDYAHSLAKPIIHRDIKPKNLLYDKQNKMLKISDFGIASKIHSESSILSQVISPASGSAPYMPYEQFMGDKPSVAMDTYAFAIVLYEMLNGEPPFTDGDFALQHKEKKVPILNIISKTQMSVITKALAKKSSDRYTSLITLLDDFKKKKGGSIVDILKQNPNEKNNKEGSEIENIRLDLNKKEKELSSHDYVSYKREIITENISLIKEEAEKNNAIAQCFLGESYTHSYGVRGDLEKAIKWYEKAAEQGNLEAQCELGFRYSFNSWGSIKDLEKAFKWCKKAANEGYPKAQWMLSNKFAQGEGIPKNSIEANRWLFKAAKQGHIGAQYNLGSKYELGDIGFTQNKEEAYKWYLEAANNGHSDAQLKIADLNFLGDGIQKNYQIAVKWYTKLAEKGISEAQNQLGNCYKYGYGVEKDMKEANYWYDLAEKNKII